MSALLRQFKEIWLVDTEFISQPGERPVPVCLVGLELRSGRKIRLWQDQLGAFPPYSTGPESLFVAYFASAEMGFHLAMGWPKPANILDLFVEFRNRYNCLPTVMGNNKLISALTQFNLDAIGVTEKQEMVDLINRGGPWTPEE